MLGEEDDDDEDNAADDEDIVSVGTVDTTDTDRRAAARMVTNQSQHTPHFSSLHSTLHLYNILTFIFPVTSPPFKGNHTTRLASLQRSRPFVRSKQYSNRQVYQQIKIQFCGETSGPCMASSTSIRGTLSGRLAATPSLRPTCHTDVQSKT